MNKSLTPWGRRLLLPAVAILVVLVILSSSLVLSSLKEDPEPRPLLDVAQGVDLVRKKKIDAVLVLGGGPPVSPRRTMAFVEKRIDAAKALYDAQPTVKILTLSAGSAHARQLLTTDGLPIWESTAAAASLLDRGVPGIALFAETTSYDTIGNAFFARTNHIDIQNWRSLVVITTDWHIQRSRAIFEWILPGYDLYFLATDSTGLSPDAVQARVQKEEASLATVRQLQTQYPTLRDVYTFLTTNHDLYTASKLAAHADDVNPYSKDPLLRESYGGGSSSGGRRGTTQDDSRTTTMTNNHTDV